MSLYCASKQAGHRQQERVLVAYDTLQMLAASCSVMRNNANVNHLRLRPVTRQPS